MPIYEYQCGKCQTVSEHIQKFSDPAPETCPDCGAKSALSKVMSQSAFHLKGGGWYADAYSSKKPESKSKDATPASSDAKSSTTPSSSSSGSKETAASKPASKD